MSTGPKPKASITPKPDGPYVIRSLEDLSNKRGPIETKPTIALCRCGGSANKPFCDGTHARIAFSSARLEGRLPDTREDYQGEDITIHDNRSICAHAGRCTDGLPSVFRYKQEPWIDLTAAPSDEIIATVRKCPSGALTYSMHGSGPDAQGDGEPTVFVAPNGPYVVTGSPELLDAALGAGATGKRFTLCRCGGSKNKPFCDGTHWSNGFADEKN